MLGRLHHLYNRAFGELQTWVNGIHHGADPKYLQYYLDECLFFAKIDVKLRWLHFEAYLEL